MRLVIALAAVLISQPASAYFVTGNDLYVGWVEDQRVERSDANADIDKAWQYTYYVLGVYDTLEALRHVCFRDSVTQGQVKDVVGKFLDDKPADRHRPAAILVALALKSAFPCDPATPD